MNEMQKFREAARERGLCERYGNLWDSCPSNKRLVDLAMDSNGIPYLCQSVAEGWCMSSDYIRIRFRRYINNNYVSKHDGYSSKLFVKHNDNILVTTTNTVIIDSDVCVVIPRNTICNIYIVNSNVRLIGTGTCYLRVFGRNNITSENTVKMIKK